MVTPSDSGAKGKPSRKAAYLVVAVVVAVIGVGLVFSGTGALKQASPGTATTSTSYDVTASSVILAAADTPLGSAYTHAKMPKTLDANVSGVQSAGYMTFSNYGGANLNMTVMVFGSTASAQKYIDSTISSAKGLSGYSNATSTLAAYEGYGTCYGYGQSYSAGIGGVATGLCTKGNVFIRVQASTTTSLDEAESDMSYLVGAAYRSTG